MPRLVLGLMSVVIAACSVASSTMDAAPPALRVDGRQFVDETGRVYIPRWVSGLTLLVRTPAQQEAYLDWARQTGFNGVRVFAGALAWADQTPDGARAALPALLDRAAARGLVVEVTALTDTGIGYDAHAHLRAVVATLAGRRGVLLELANEVGHHSQAANLTSTRLRAWGTELATPRGVLWAIGAADDPIRAGDYTTDHLDRGPPFWTQVAGVRGIGALADTFGAPVINNEPTGADERPGRETGRQRWDDPAGFFALGTLDRAFHTGGVHHSQAGLMAERPGPVQQRCADAYVAGHRAVERVLGEKRGEFLEVGPGAFAFVSGDRGALVRLGLTGEAGAARSPGWRQIGVVATMTARDGSRVDVVEIAR